MFPRYSHAPMLNDLILMFSFLFFTARTGDGTRKLKCKCQVVNSRGFLSINCVTNFSLCFFLLLIHRFDPDAPSFSPSNQLYLDDCLLIEYPTHNLPPLLLMKSFVRWHALCVSFYQSINTACRVGIQRPLPPYHLKSVHISGNAHWYHSPLMSRIQRLKQNPVLWSFMKEINQPNALI